MLVARCVLRSIPRWTFPLLRRKYCVAQRDSTPHGHRAAKASTRYARDAVRSRDTLCPGKDVARGIFVVYKLCDLCGLKPPCTLRYFPEIIFVLFVFFVVQYLRAPSGLNPLLPDRVAQDQEDPQRQEQHGRQADPE